MTPVKHVLGVCVHVPVKQVCRGMIGHVTVGDEAHVGVLGSDGCEEGNVVFHIPWLATILQQDKMIRPCDSISVERNADC